MVCIIYCIVYIMYGVYVYEMWYTMYDVICIYMNDLSKFVPSSCHLFPRGSTLYALEVQFGQQFMPKSVNAKSAKQGCLRSLILNSF